MIVGAALHFTFHKRGTLDIGLAVVLKLIALPLAAAGMAVPLGPTGATLASVILICDIPTAPSAYVLARRMGGDTRLMTSITGVQTILAAATLPAIFALIDHLAM